MRNPQPEGDEVAASHRRASALREYLGIMERVLNPDDILILTFKDGSPEPRELSELFKSIPSLYGRTVIVDASSVQASIVQTNDD